MVENTNTHTYIMYIMYNAYVCVCIYTCIQMYISIYIYPNDALTMAIKSLIIQMQTDRLTTNIFASQFFCKNLCHLFSFLHFCHPIYNFLCEWGKKNLLYISTCEILWKQNSFKISLCYSDDMK